MGLLNANIQNQRPTDGNYTPRTLMFAPVEQKWWSNSRRVSVTLQFTRMCGTGHPCAEACHRHEAACRPRSQAGTVEGWGYGVWGESRYSETRGMASMAMATKGGKQGGRLLRQRTRGVEGKFYHFTGYLMKQTLLLLRDRN